MTNDYLEQFKEYFIIKGYTSKSIQSISLNISYFLKWIETENLTIEEVRNNDVLAYIQYKRKTGNKPRTLQLITIALNHFFNFLVAEHQFNENPTSNVKIQGIKRKTLQEILTPQELETIYKSYNTQNTELKTNDQRLATISTLAKKRNKIILGLLVYQGIRSEELGKLELTDLELREGKITIQGSSRSNTRTLKLEPHQIIDLLDYINETRKEILQTTNKTSNKLFISVGTSDNYKNLLQKLVKNIKALNPKLKDIQHIRTNIWQDTDM
jgi:site-specific recombinase XerD